MFHNHKFKKSTVETILNPLKVILVHGLTKNSLSILTFVFLLMLLSQKWTTSWCSNERLGWEVSFSLSLWQLLKTLKNYVPSIYRKYPKRLYRLSAGWTKLAPRRKSTGLYSFNMRVVMAGRWMDLITAGGVHRFGKRTHTSMKELERSITRVSRKYHANRGVCNARMQCTARWPDHTLTGNLRYDFPSTDRCASTSIIINN